jgi:hypothetical protein
VSSVVKIKLDLLELLNLLWVQNLLRNDDPSYPILVYESFSNPSSQHLDGEEEEEG